MRSRGCLSLSPEPEPQPHSLRAPHMTRALGVTGFGELRPRLRRTAPLSLARSPSCPSSLFRTRALSLLPPPPPPLSLSPSLSLLSLSRILFGRHHHDLDAVDAEEGVSTTLTGVSNPLREKFTFQHDLDEAYNSILAVISIDTTLIKTNLVSEVRAIVKSF